MTRKQQPQPDTRNRPVRTKAYESMTDFKGILTQYKRVTQKERVIIVVMHYRNGTRSTRVFFLEDEGVFYYKKNAYIIDDTCKRFDTTYQENVIEYFESVSLPIKHNYNYQDLEAAAVGMLDNENASPDSIGLDVVSSLNPHSLYTWIKSSVIQKVMKGELIDEMLKKTQFFLILTFIGVVLVLVLNLYTSGLLSSIPFLG